MTFPALIIPTELEELIENRLWPASHLEAIQQNLKSRIAPEDVHRLITEEDEIILYPTPFATLQDDHHRSIARIGNLDEIAPRATLYFRAYARALTQIDADRALFIGDFGPGSDTPIALDYSKNPNEPVVIALKWHIVDESDESRWMELSPSFRHFAKTLKLWHLPKFKR